MIIQCDFDGTITTNNISLVLREKFAIGNWRKIESDYLGGHITVEQSNKLQFALIEESREKLEAFARKNAEIRPGFLEFVRYCQESAIPFAIVSSGLDFYIEAVLDKIGASDLELHCAQTSFTKDGITVSYAGPDGGTVREGFKKKYLAWLRKRGGRVVYIGDGLSDLEAARQADHVFATGHLLDLLDTYSIERSAFSDFYDLQRQIRLL